MYGGLLLIVVGVYVLGVSGFGFRFGFGMASLPLCGASLYGSAVGIWFLINR